MEPVPIAPIGRIFTPYRDKFGVPRQPGLAPSARGRLVFESQFRREEAVRGLEEFSHLWLVFLFHEVPEGQEKLSVRPPRLGGNEKVGVFATRSPYRPNRLGLSVCRLDGIDHSEADGPALLLSGVDLVSGTPVVDVKPYLPYADSVEGAEAGFAHRRPEAVEVVISPEAAEGFGALPAELRLVVCETLRWDARPAFHEQERTYYLCLKDWEIAWTVQEQCCVVVGVAKLDSEA